MSNDELTIRIHGQHGPAVMVLHGGPAAAGSARPVAEQLGQRFRAFEPLQRGSGGQPLSVARHVEDLRHVMETHCPNGSPALVGESWGAMLALAFAAEYPRQARPIVLVGCGTFEPRARQVMQDRIDERLSQDVRDRLARLPEDLPEPERLRRSYELIQSVYLVDPIDEQAPSLAGTFDADAHRQTWQDMLRLQDEGVYPRAFAAIDSPVLMIHGSYDPHPGALIRDSLVPYLPQLEYVELDRCGHQPWKERHARQPFFHTLQAWLGDHL